jgi:hypothetical protein
LLNALNAIERSRLKKLNTTNSFGLTGKELDKMVFIEQEIYLDASYQNNEFLLYRNGVVFYRSRGCTLFNVNEKG